MRTKHSYSSDLTCSACGLGFEHKAESCEGPTAPGRRELRRRIAAENQAAQERKARAAAEHFARIAARKRRQ